MTKPNKSISPLRQRMLEDMAIRKLGSKTRKDYIRAVVNLEEILVLPVYLMISLSSDFHTSLYNCLEIFWVPTK